MKHIVALSGGKDSTCMALLLKEFEGGVDYTYVCTPTGNELPEMLEHWGRLEAILGKSIVSLDIGKSLVGLILEQAALPNHMMRWCTRMLKIEPFMAYVAANMPATVYVGIRADETDRSGAEYRSDLVVKRFPLVEYGFNLSDVLLYLAQQEIIIPPRTDCAFCFYQTTYEWWVLWKEYPELYARAEAIESLVGHTFRYGNPLRREFKKWPSALADLRLKFEAGEVPETKRMSDRGAMCSVCAR